MKDTVLEEILKSKKYFVFESGVNVRSLKGILGLTIEDILIDLDYMCHNMPEYVLCNQKYSHKDTLPEVSYEEYYDCLGAIYRSLNASPMMRSTLRKNHLTVKKPISYCHLVPSNERYCKQGGVEITVRLTQAE
jgi:hypothetical protein